VLERKLPSQREGLGEGKKLTDIITPTLALPRWGRE